MRECIYEYILSHEPVSRLSYLCKFVNVCHILHSAIQCDISELATEFSLTGAFLKFSNSFVIKIVNLLEITLKLLIEFACECVTSKKKNYQFTQSHKYVWACKIFFLYGCRWASILWNLDGIDLIDWEWHRKQFSVDIFNSGYENAIPSIDFISGTPYTINKLVFWKCISKCDSFHYTSSILFSFFIIILCCHSCILNSSHLIWSLVELQNYWLFQSFHDERDERTQTIKSKPNAMCNARRWRQNPLGAIGRKLSVSKMEKQGKIHIKMHWQRKRKKRKRVFESQNTSMESMWLEVIIHIVKAA